jgi:hypothetical protein
MSLAPDGSNAAGHGKECAAMHGAGQPLTLVELEAELASDQYGTALQQRLNQLDALAQRCRIGLGCLPAEPFASRLAAALAGAEAAAASLPILHSQLRRQDAGEQTGDPR